MAKVNIAAIGVHHPKNEVGTADLLRESGLVEMGADPNCLEDQLGISHVRFSAEHEYPSDLAVNASVTALERANLKPFDIDAVFYCGIDRDAQEPSTACFVASKLGMNDAHLQLAVDISNACHGMSAAIEAAEASVLLGKWKNVLICTGEKASKRFHDLCSDVRENKYSKGCVTELAGFLSCGDAGAAIILGRSENDSGIVYLKTATRPEHASLCQLGDMFDQHKKVMKMKTICDATLDLTVSMKPKSIYRKVGWDLDDVDYFVQHQVGKLPYLIATRVYQLPRKKSPVVYPRYGNLTSASIPAALDECQIKKGDKVVVQSSGSGIVVSQYAFVA